MITFTKKEVGEQFISVFVYDGFSTNSLSNELISKHPELKSCLFASDELEIIFRIPDEGLSFPLNKLRYEADKLCDNAITHFPLTEEMFCGKNVLNW